MIDHDAVQTALRAHLAGVIVATTGDTAIAATADGFARDAGSFVDDGFAIGMEVVGSGFPDPGTMLHAIVTSVSPLDMRVSPFILAIVNGAQSVTRPPLVAAPIDAPRRIDAILPSMRAWENSAPATLSAFIPVAGIPYLGDEYSPSTSILIAQTWSEARGDYFLHLYGVTNSGTSGIRRIIGALKRRFAPNTVLPASDHGVRIDYDPMPESGAITMTTRGPVIILTIPWIVRSRFIVPV